MARKKRKSKKIRVDFRQNRAQRGRSDDWTRRYRDDDARDGLEDERQSESVSGKGDLSRKRTIVVDEQEDPLIDEALWLRGIVTRVHGLISLVEQESGRSWECTSRRVLRTRLIEQRNPVAVGDRVWISDQTALHDGAPVGVIERVAGRTTTLCRRDRRGRAQTIVANAEQLLIVTSVAQPNLKPHLIDRYLVAAAMGELRPIIVFNKWDLLSAAATERSSDLPTARQGDATTERPSDGGAKRQSENPGVSSDESAASTVDFEDDEYAGPAMTVEQVVCEFRSLGYCCINSSALTGLGLEQLRTQLTGRMTVLSGQSGVGKSSLINCIQPELRLEVADVSEATEKGRHTTSLARLLRLELGGFLVDTPGIRAFELWNVEPGELEACFTEFVPLVGECHFNDCHHTEEVGCAIRAAVEAGAISPRRYYSYYKLLMELAR